MTDDINILKMMYEQVNKLCPKSNILICTSNKRSEEELYKVDSKLGIIKIGETVNRSIGKTYFIFIDKSKKLIVLNKFTGNTIYEVDNVFEFYRRDACNYKYVFIEIQRGKKDDIVLVIDNTDTDKGAKIILEVVDGFINDYNNMNYRDKIEIIKPNNREGNNTITIYTLHSNGEINIETNSKEIGEYLDELRSKQ